ncbi:hypothetical protein BH11MYX4_BH11MYX4_31970 [soil metagenome]
MRSLFRFHAGVTASRVVHAHAEASTPGLKTTTVLLRQGPPSPEIRGSLEHLLARTEDPRLAARIRFAFEASSRPN